MHVMLLAVKSGRVAISHHHLCCTDGNQSMDGVCSSSKDLSARDQRTWQRQCLHCAERELVNTITTPPAAPTLRFRWIPKA